MILESLLFLLSMCACSVNRYEVRQALRKVKQDERNKNMRELRLLEKEQAGKRYRDSYKLLNGFLPRIIPNVTAAKLNRWADQNYAKAHARELGGQDESE